MEDAVTGLVAIYVVWLLVMVVLYAEHEMRHAVQEEREEWAAMVRHYNKQESH